MEHLQAIGKPSPFVCPDCHGGLWEVEGSRPQRYRCHTGHAFTLRTLQHTIANSSDEALWSALRSLQEKQMLLQHMLVQLRAMPDGTGASDVEASIGEIDQQIALLRKALETTPKPVE